MMSYQKWSRGRGSTPARSWSDAPAGVPGKRTLTEALGPALQAKMLVQHRAPAGLPPADIHAAAAHGVSGAAGALPHLDLIQASFGKHDVSAIQAHTDAAASEGAAAMGAVAFATGDHVAFAGAPDLHTAAHEAAHVVQQRGGVQLRGGVGEANDPYEQNADAVADRVVAGQSAEDLLPPVGNGGSTGSQGVQRLAKIQAEGKRPRDLDQLCDNDLRALIAQLEGGEQRFHIYDPEEEEDAAKLLTRAQAKLNSREQETGSFNVRGRAVASDGFLFSADAGVRQMALANGISAYHPEKEPEVRTIYAQYFADWKELFHHPQLGNTKFYGPPGSLRGPRENAASPTGRETILYTPSREVVSTLLLTDVCKRGNVSASRDSAMGNATARNYAWATIGDEALKHSWEWLHLVGSAIGGGNTLGNLIAGTYDTNTLMIPLEQTIVEYAAKNKPTAQNPIMVKATATLYRDGDKYIWVAESITLEVQQHGSEPFWLGPIKQKIDQLTRPEFDFYRYVFRRMAGLAG